jgi:hypothetical protein
MWGKFSRTFSDARKHSVPTGVKGKDMANKDIIKEETKQDGIEEV